MAKLASNLDAMHSIRNSMPKIPPIESVATRKPKKLTLGDSLVAPREKIDVPNHILNTKIYAKLQRNNVFEVNPVEVHFAGFEVAIDSSNEKNQVKRYIQKLRIINISAEIQNMTVLPPQTEFFEIFYVKPERLVPGFALEIQVIFKPNEYRYYSDSIKIYSEGDENLFIPIHAYPIVSSYDFPTKFSFPKTQLGKSLTKSFNMRSTAPIEFEYMIDIVQSHPAFHIEPLEGIIPFNRDAFINVTFSPREFCTATMTIQMVISQFNSKPIICTFYGSSLPGMSRNEVKNMIKKQLQLENESKTNEAFDPRCFSPLSLARANKRNKKIAEFNKIVHKNDEDNKDVAPKQDSFIDCEGYRFPKQLTTPWSISKVLIQKKNKLSTKELRSSAKSSIAISAQVKEALFIQKVTELEDEERRNQLKWQVKLGESLVDAETRKDILQSRAKAEYEYKLSVGVPFIQQETKRTKTVVFDNRTVRMCEKLARSDVAFDMFKNKIWQLRFLSLERFIQAARKVILKQRLERVLFLLRRFIDSWNEALNENNENEDVKLNIENYIEIYVKKLNGENLNQNEVLKILTPKTMGTYYFPYVSEFKEFQNQKVRHYEKLSSISKLDSLDQVAVKPIEFQIKAQIPYSNLAIPVTYKLNNYNQNNINTYVPKYEDRLLALRQGAEDELTQIDASLIRHSPGKTKDREIEENDPVTMPKVVTVTEPDIEAKKGTKIIDLDPSPQLSEPVEYSPMHIFNPAPGLISYQKLLPYSGVDLNHHLNPLPRFERDQAFTTQKRFLDREDVIKGIMSWKKFPSQGLISLSNTPTLTDVWVPRWSNTLFSDDLVPSETPALLSGLPEEDKDNLLDEPEEETQSINQNSVVYLTPDMCNAQFNIPEIFETREKVLKEEALRQLNRRVYYNQQEAQFPNGDKLPATNLPVGGFGQVPRDQRQQELEYYLNKQYNSIGLRLQTKLNSIEKQFANPDKEDGTTDGTAPES